MTIISTVLVYPRPDAALDDVMKIVKSACDIVTGHGAQNVTVFRAAVAGNASNTFGVLSTATDWADFGRIMQKLRDDEAYTALEVEAMKIAEYHSYVNETIEL